MKKKLITLVIFLAVALIWAQFPAEDNNKNDTTNTVQVVDGDTLTLENGEKVRLIGINAPEKSQPYGQQAAKRLRELTNNNQITLTYDKDTKDAYNRTLAYAYVDNTFINEQMIKEGLALVETVPPNETYEGTFTEAEIDAQKNCRGLWEGLCVQGEQTDSCISIDEIHADAQGDDSKNMNDEWITLKNSCPQEVPLDGYLLKDRSASNSYFFKNISIYEYGTLTIYSGCGEDATAQIYWQCPQKKSPVWNNEHDQAYLYDKYGKLTATKGY